MKRLGERASSLSADTKADAGQKASNSHIPRHWLYCVLGNGYFTYFIGSLNRVSPETFPNAFNGKFIITSKALFM